MIFQFFLDNSNDPTTPDPVPIQKEVGISIEFSMGPIPIDNQGCYVNYSFPNDMRLPAGALQSYQSSKD
jgi:hypothetical protein